MSVSTMETSFVYALVPFVVAAGVWLLCRPKTRVKEQEDKAPTGNAEVANEDVEIEEEKTNDIVFEDEVPPSSPVSHPNVSTIDDSFLNESAIVISPVKNAAPDLHVQKIMQNMQHELEMVCT
jgi:hypothetical protein